MTPTSTANSSPEPPLWKLWENPIFRRYCTSRLRAKGVMIGGFLVLLLAGFVFALAREAVLGRSSGTPEAAARMTIVPLVILQAFLLFVLGTAQASGGMISEADEGVLSYQRLLPLSPMSKVLGFLFGLPIREWFLFLVPMPFSIWAFWKGNVPLHCFTSIYGSIFCAGVLYHLTGLFIGTVVQNRRWAFLCAIGFIFAIYTLVPQLSKFGLTTFRYISIQPVIEENLPYFFPESFENAIKVAQRYLKQAPFFGLKFHAVWFSLFCQLGLIVAFLLMLYRRWRKTESLLLGKVSAVLLNAWLHFQLLGNALPLIKTGDVFPSREFSRFIPGMGEWKPSESEALAICVVYAILALVLAALLTNLCTPDRDMQLRAWRRARKYNHKKLPLLGDASTSFWSALAMGVTGAVAWYLFAKGVVESRFFSGRFISITDAMIVGGVLVLFCLSFQAALEAEGRGKLGLHIIIIGIVPLMIAAVLAASSNSFQIASQWVAGASPLATLAYGVSTQVDIAQFPKEVSRSLPAAFQFWGVVHGLAALWWVKRLYKARKAIHVFSEEPATTPPSAS